jgi:hypothetical protein
MITLTLASVKLVWTDEFFTVYLARARSFSDLLRALSTGGEPNPPAFFWIVHGSVAIFGENGIGLRFPSVVAFWVMQLCLYAFVSRRTSRLYALIAYLFPLITTAYEYAYDGRAYALVLGFTGIALVCWDSTRSMAHRKLATVGLALSLVLATANHYYAILLALPFGLAQLARSWRMRRAEVGVWLAIACIAIPPLLAAPMVRASFGMASHFWAPPHWLQAVTFFADLAAPAMIFVPLFALAAGAWVLIAACPKLPLDGRLNEPSRPAPNWHVEDVVLTLAFVSLPAVTMLLAKLVTQAYTFRYALPTVIGVTLLLAFALFRSSQGIPPLVAAFFAVTMVLYYVAFPGIRSIQARRADRSSLLSTEQWLKSANPALLPVAFGDFEVFAKLSYYAGPTVTRQAIFPTDANRSWKYLGHDTIARGLERLHSVMPLRLSSYEQLFETGGEFLVYTPVDMRWCWLLPALLEDGIRPTVINQNGSFLLLHVTGGRRLGKAARSSVNGDPSSNGRLAEAKYSSNPGSAANGNPRTEATRIVSSRPMS